MRLFFIPLIILFCSTFLVAQNYNIDISPNGFVLTISNDNLSNNNLFEKFNSLDSSYSFIFALDNEKPNFTTSNKELFRINRIGSLRNVAFIHIILNNKILSNIKKKEFFEVKFNNSISQNQIEPYDSEFFADFENFTQVNALRKTTSNKDTGNRLLSSDWFNFNNDYVKFYSTKDIPSIVAFTNILKVQSKWNGLESKFLKLYQRGKEVPILILDNDGLIDDNDTLIFLGSRAFGDTTYYENYTKYESFFLTYETNSDGLRLQKLNNNIPDAIPTNKVWLDKHLEEDHDYSDGTNYKKGRGNYLDINRSYYPDSRTVMGEGWFWIKLNPKNYEFFDQGMSDIFRYQIKLNPSPDFNDNLKIALIYQSAQDSINKSSPYAERAALYDVNVNLNSKYNVRNEFMGFRRDSIIIDTQNDNILPGKNQFSLVQKEVNPLNNERLLVDYFTIRGYINPVAEDGVLNFTIKDDNKRQFKLHNYKSNRLIVINKTNSSIALIENAKSGFFLRSGAGYTDTNFVTFGINDSIYTAVGLGFHFFILNSQTKEYKYYNSRNNSINFNELIDNLPNNSIIQIASVGRNNIGNMESLFKKLGVTNNLNDINGNWIFNKIVGTNYTNEKFSNDFVQISEFVESQFGLTYTFDLSLQENIGSEIITTDFVSSEFLTVHPVELSNLKLLDTSVSALYITHKDFYPAAKHLAEYREKTQNRKVKLIDVETIFNQFNYGNSSPHAIKKYFEYYYKNSEQFPKFVTFFGDASWDARKVLKVSISENFIPTYGKPASDTWYAFLDGEKDFSADIVIGRLPFYTLEQAYNIIDKIIYYDSCKPNIWMKNYLTLIGGNSFNEKIMLGYASTDLIRDTLINGVNCGFLDTVWKNTNAPSSSSQGSEIREKVNKGNNWVIYAGHAAAEVFSLDGWKANDLNNYGRYGMLSTVSCNSSAFAEPALQYCRNEEYVIAKDKGFIVSTGTSASATIDANFAVLGNLTKGFSDNKLKSKILGEFYLRGLNIMAPVGDDFFTIYHMTFLGDPLTEIRVGKEIDPYIYPENVKIVPQNNKQYPLDEDEFVSIIGDYFNYGYDSNLDYRIILIREYNGKSDTITITNNSLCRTQSFDFKLDIKNKYGIHNIQIIIDPDSVFEFDDKTNNIVRMSFEVFTQNLIFFDPANNWNINPRNPQFRLINPIDENDNYNFYFEIINDKNELILSENSIDNTINFDISNNYIDWLPKIDLSNYRKLQLKSKIVNKIDSKSSLWSYISFYPDKNFEKDKLKFNIDLDEFDNLEIRNDLNINKETNNLELESIEIPFKTSSVRGVLDSNSKYTKVPYVNIEVNNQVFIDGLHDRGFNIVQFSSSPKGINAKFKRFDTWGQDHSHPDENWYKDSANIHFVQFLKDSIKNDEYVIIATNSSVFRLPYLYKKYAVPPSEGSADTLLAQLKNLGSKIADTLKIDTITPGFDISFTMIGYKGAKVGSIPEKIVMNGDSANLQGNLILYNNSGNFVTKQIGKAKKWNSIRFIGNFTPDINNHKYIIYGINSKNEIDTLFEINNTEILDISTIDANIYKSIKIEVKYLRKDTTLAFLKSNEVNNGLSSIFVDFIPLDELAINKKITQLINSEVMRGDSVQLNYQIENLSLRNSVDRFSTLIDVSRGGTSNIPYYIDINSLEANSLDNNSLIIPSDNLDQSNPITLNVNYDNKINEFYSFNNKHNLEIKTYKDTIKPKIKLIIDGNEFHKYDYISILPKFRIELYDNSKLQITDPNSIKARINGYLVPIQRTLNHNFESINDGSNLKAVLTFEPDSLDFEDISIIIQFYDNEGNRDTLETIAFIKRNSAEIKNTSTYPNPSIDIVNIKFLYIAPFSQGEAIIEIFDLQGNLLHTLSKNVVVGNNEFQISRLDLFKNSLSSQMYIYRIRINSNYFVEPKFGKFIIVE